MRTEIRWRWKALVNEANATIAVNSKNTVHKIVMCEIRFRPDNDYEDYYVLLQRRAVW